MATAELVPMAPAQALVDGVSSSLRRRLCMAVVRLHSLSIPFEHHSPQGAVCWWLIELG